MTLVVARAEAATPTRRPAWPAAAALTLAVLAAFVGAAVAQPPLGPLRTVERLNLPRYMRTWYEIAKFPNRFQAKCASDTRAEYTAQPDGTVRVVNRCRTENGETTEAVGVARQVGGPDSPKLQVRFAPAWLSWWPGVWGDYWIVDLEPDYQLVAVSEPSREYLWILARSPRLDPARQAAMVAPCRAGARCEQVAARVRCWAIRPRTVTWREPLWRSQTQGFNLWMARRQLMGVKG